VTGLALFHVPEMAHLTRGGEEMIAAEAEAADAETAAER